MSGGASLGYAARSLPCFLGFFVAGISGLAAETARMQLPDDFAASAERQAIDGMGGRNRGEYSLAAGGGSFTRIESRLAVADPLFAQNRGKSSFTLSSPDHPQAVSGECEFRENVVTVGVLTFDPKKLAYVCELSSDGRFDGTLTLGEPKPRSMRERVMAQDIRVGLAEIGSVRIELESVHRYSGSRLVSPVPVGYTLALDGRVSGAVELTDTNPTVLLGPDLDQHERLAMLTAALAIAVLRDPATSALGDDDW